MKPIPIRAAKEIASHFGGIVMDEPPRYARRDGAVAFGLFGCEDRILHRTDAGQSDAAVAAELRVSSGYVKTIRQRYNGSWADSVAFEAMVRAGTRALADRIALVGGSWA